MCLKTVNTKSFIANKINIIAKAPVRYSYDSFARAKLIHNIREGARTIQLRFIRKGESGEINSQQYFSLNILKILQIWTSIIF